MAHFIVARTAGLAARVREEHRRVLLAVVVAASSCGGDARRPESQPAAAPASQAVAYFRVDPATAGSVHGTVTYRGTKPRPAVVAMDAEPPCAALHASKPAYDDQLVVGSGGGLANAFVYLKAGLEGKKFEPSREPVVLDQRGCIFAPRVVGLQAGGALAVRNSDPLEHNVHPGPKNNYEWNEGMSPRAPDVVHRFARHEVMIPVKCNVHPWMRAWIGVVEHPYFAVTGPDGVFDLKNVPPGEYTIAVWHEQLGELTEPLALASSATQSLVFTYGGDRAKGR